MAIIAWNTLKAPYVWDVTNTEYEGTINLGNSTRSLLGIYFRDYVYTVENTYGVKETIKEAKELTVAAVPSTDKKLEKRQIRLEDEGEEGGWSKFASAFTTNSKEDSYKGSYTKDDEEVDYIVATIPEEVYENLDNLQGKEVTVLFGEDNIVSLIIVTNDGVVDGEFVEKYDSAKKEITIGGTKYKFADATPVAYVNNSESTFKMTKILEILKEEDNKDFTKKVKANVLLDDEEDIKRLDLYVSGTYSQFNTVEGIVTKVRNEKITYYTHNATDGKLNKKVDYDYSNIKEKNLPTVSKNGKIISLDDIAVNDVITIYYDAQDSDDIISIYVASDKVEGEVTRTKAADNSIYIDGTQYVSSMNGKALLTTDDVEDNKPCTIGTDVEKGDTVSAFVNIYGEYVVLANEDANSGAWTFALVRGIKNVDENDDDELVGTLKLLLPDGTKSTSYKVVADVDDYIIQGSGQNKESDFEDYLEGYIGQMVAFKANADFEIVLDLEDVSSSDFDDAVEEDLVWVAKISGDDIVMNNALPSDFKKDYEVTVADAAVASKDYKTITYTYDSHEYVKDFENTKIFDVKEQEVSEKWTAMVNGNALVGKAVVVSEDEKAGIKYIIFKTTEAATSDSIYARLIDVDSDEVELFDGEEKVTYEHDNIEDIISKYATNSFVEYETNSRNEVSSMKMLVDVEEFDEGLEYDEAIPAGILNSGNETKLVVEDKLNNAIKVTAKVVANAYKTHPDFNTATGDAALQIYAIDHVLPDSAKNGEEYTIVQRNKALNIAYPNTFDGDVKIKAWTVGSTESSTVLPADADLNVLLNDTDGATVEVYKGTYITLDDLESDKLVAKYTITPNIDSCNEGEETVEYTYGYEKDNFRVESIYTNRFEYDEVEVTTGNKVTLGTVRIDKEDTTIYIMNSDGTYEVSKDFSTIKVGSYVIPFKTAECDPEATANILVVID